jgi:DtxR family transcriptional regulator, Mn-dependent transcriptional regulator
LNRRERTLNRQPAERYLYAVLELEEAGVAPIRARLCDRLNATHAAVETNVRRLARSGYVRAERNRVLKLTTDGQTLARTLLRNLRVAARFLSDLDVDDATIRDDTEKWALVMSNDVAEALSDLLSGSAPCPFDQQQSLD